MAYNRANSGNWPQQIPSTFDDEDEYGYNTHTGYDNIYMPSHQTQPPVMTQTRYASSQYDPYSAPAHQGNAYSHTHLAADSYPLQDFGAHAPSRGPSPFHDASVMSGQASPYGAGQYDENNTYFPGDIAHVQLHDDSMDSPLLQTQFPRELHDGLPSPGEPFSQVPAGPQPRRWKTMKRVELYNGNLVLDCPVPQKLLQSLPIKEGREFTHMRYTAATGDPSEFKQNLFTLRQALYSPPRHTELFIVITMYNENEILFARTMHSVMKNIAHLCGRNRSQIWGESAWTKVVVCVVSDGRSKIHPRTLSFLAAMGVYQDGIAKNMVNNKPVTAHLYEYTTQISIDADLKFKGADRGIVPVQVLFCLKEKNQKKINSHRWFFQAFGSILNPNVCVLLDAGTQPGEKSIYALWKSFDINSNVAGACGEIVAMKGKLGKNLLNPLVAAQNFEYKMSNILDKPLESVFGFISVLPGAFSAYRYIALQNDASGQGPLASYFKGETMHGANAGIFEANMYLAEDRILCFELVAKRNCSWILHYVKSAYAVTDVPDELPELISQRRRWLNGSFFAAVYALWHTFSIWRSSHGLFRKLGFHIEFLYQGISMLFSWFGLGNFFITFSILAKSLGTNVWAEGTTNAGRKIFGPGAVLYTVCTWIYAALIVMCFVLSMGNRPQGSKWAYMSAMVFFACLMAYMTFAAAWLSYVSIETLIQGVDASGNRSAKSVYEAISTNKTFYSLVVSLLSTYGLYTVASILYLEPWHMITSFFQYVLISPSYLNILNVYAFCNTHDISWGTKGDTGVKTDLGIVKADASGAVDVGVPQSDIDIDENYNKAISVLTVKEAEVHVKRSASTKQEDYYKAFRTRVVLAWILSNGLLIGLILGLGGVSQIGTSSTEETTSIYLSVIFWAVAGLAAFRFVGCVLYLIFRLFNGGV